MWFCFPLSLCCCFFAGTSFFLFVFLIASSLGEEKIDTRKHFSNVVRLNQQPVNFSFSKDLVHSMRNSECRISGTGTFDFVPLKAYPLTRVTSVALLSLQMCFRQYQCLKVPYNPWKMFVEDGRCTCVFEVAIFLS